MGIIRDNPVFWREAIPRGFSDVRPTTWKVLAGGLFVASISIAMVFRGRNGVSDLTVYAVWLWAGATYLFAAVQTARTIAEERQKGTWDALLLTRQRPAEIIYGKLFGVLIPPWLVGLLCLPAFLLLLLNTAPAWKDQAVAHLPMAYLVAVPGGLFIGSMGLFFSMRCRSAITAQVWTLLLGIVLPYLFAPLVAFACIDLPPSLQDAVLFVIFPCLLLVMALILLGILVCGFNYLDRKARGN